MSTDVGQAVSAAESAALAAARAQVRVRVRELAATRHSAERRERARTRDRLKEEGTSRRFWQGLVRADLEPAAAKLRGGGRAGGSTGPGITLDTFVDHFQRIATAPDCEWFNKQHIMEVEQAVRQSVWLLREGEFAEPEVRQAAEQRLGAEGEGGREAVTGVGAAAPTVHGCGGSRSEPRWRRSACGGGGQGV